MSIPEDPLPTLHFSSDDDCVAGKKRLPVAPGEICGFGGRNFALGLMLDRSLKSNRRTHV